MGGSAIESWPTRAPATQGHPDRIGGPFADWRAKVELFEQLRREHKFGVGTIAGVAAKFSVHRHVVRWAIASALPPQQHYPERVKPKLGAVAEFWTIDRRAPRKQHHTARCIHRRILKEFSRGGGIDGSQSRARAQTLEGAGAAQDVHAAALQLGTENPGRLV